MQPAYYENFEEIQNKYWSMLDDAITNRGSQFRIPVFICAHQDEVDGRIVVLRKSDRANINTVAKCVYGISDTLATNIFAQSGKCRVECIYFPCDTAPELETLSPKGYVKVFPRRIDLENVRNLKKFERTNVVMSFKELKKEVKKREKCLKKFSS